MSGQGLKVLGVATQSVGTLAIYHVEHFGRSLGVSTRGACDRDRQNGGRSDKGLGEPDSTLNLKTCGETQAIQIALNRPKAQTRAAWA